MSEQWKTDGKCLECRRHGYCKKQCKKNKEVMYAEIQRIIRQKMAEKMSQTSGNSSETSD